MFAGALSVTVKRKRKPKLPSDIFAIKAKAAPPSLPPVAAEGTTKPARVVDNSSAIV